MTASTNVWSGAATEASRCHRGFRGGWDGAAAALVAAGYDPAEEFIFGLDLVLAALEPLRASA